MIYINAFIAPLWCARLDVMQSFPTLVSTIERTMKMILRMITVVIRGLTHIYFFKKAFYLLPDSSEHPLTV